MEKIHINEVGPRDGFQNQAKYIPLEHKLEIIKKMVESGLEYIQITSFVSPKAIPQMKDSKEIASVCLEKFPDVKFFALVPNLYGAKLAWESGIRRISFVVSLSKSHNKANINRTHEESFLELKKIVEAYPEMEVCLDLATTFGCPFEGKYNAEIVVGFLKAYIDLGIKMVNLCDTIGIGNPKEVREIVGAVQESYPNLDLQIHIHDTRNMGMVNTLAAIECGVDKIQSTLGGLGGCPFAPGASGNLATEDIVYMLNDMGYVTGVDFEKLIDASKYQKIVIPDGNFSGHQMNIESKSQQWV
ncbi:hydroxymethylglutaryl-CoA lyase [Caldibacillus lycopersici]|uniref:Hydroxymethylglutaryl-CoA lyase n=1 Tax=Perspicuibacillus lycopersici TaxID=1325689 RepID=A0AAE3IVB3_9BACI|nr:hydroxymethylglutaryl-CoA lyase [Perspicuibacillus lycopersici]MCU9614882.1 hydroxymethylglutaryl-CoA lyase [Perspicuibacillus lycopersici]